MSSPAIPAPALAQLRRRWVPGPDWSRDPVGWAATRAKTFIWSKQREILESVRDNPNTAVKSCHSAGKSFIAAEAAMWWIDSHPPGEAFVVTSAPTADQVRAVLWREINRAHKRIYGEGKAQTGGGRMNLTEWYDEGGELVAFGRKPNDYNPTAFQGIHARYVLVILDEAGGIPRALWDAASSLTSNENGRILAIGNPDDPDSHFATVCESEVWHMIHISIFDTPNFTDEVVPHDLREMLASKRWQEEKVIEWGETSSVYIAKVLGLFPQDSEDGVVPYSFASRCQVHELEPVGEDELGLDPARGGTDKAVLWHRKGPVALEKWEWAYTPDPHELAKLVLPIIIQTKATSLKIDADGLGWGLSAIFDEWHLQGLHDCVTVPVLGSAPATGSAQVAGSKAELEFLNTRAEMWWMARELSRLGQWDLRALELDDLADLTVPKWHTNNPRQRIQIEKKSDLKKRLGRSPDSGDALILAFWEPSFEAEDHTHETTSARLPTMAGLSR